MRSRDTSGDVTLRNVTLIVFCREPLTPYQNPAHPAPGRC
jgi:hypothetical protein